MDGWPAVYHQRASAAVQAKISRDKVNTCYKSPPLYQALPPFLCGPISVFFLLPSLPSTLVSGHISLSIRSSTRASDYPQRHSIFLSLSLLGTFKMTAVNTAFSVFSGIGFILSVVPLWWHLESWNVGTCMYMVWTALACLVHFVDSVVWAGNAVNWAPGWCDIGTFGTLH